jgi:iron complex transport system substrate-binding protein
VAAVLLLAGTACGERSEPTGAHIRIYPVNVQGAGDRPTIVSHPPQRIVPIGSGPRTILRALGLGKRVVTVDDSLVGLPLVGSIKRARPDLIVASGETDPLDLARARAATHAAVYVEPDDSIADVEGAIGDIGLMTGKPVAARRLTASIERTRRRIGAKLSGFPDVSTFADLGDFTTVPSHSLVGDLIDAAQGRNVAGASPEQGPFPLRQLAKLDPSAYLSIAGATTLAHLRANPVTRKLRAVKSGRFGEIPGRLVAPGPRIGEGLARIARILHPDAFR